MRFGPAIAILMLTAAPARAQDGWTTLALSATASPAGDFVQPSAVRVRSFDECPLAVSIDWRNPGSAPVDGMWRTHLWIRSADAMTSLPARSEKNLPSVSAGASITDDNCYSLPVGMGGGNYDLYLQVADPASQRTMALPLANGDSDNRYWLGAISFR